MNSNQVIGKELSDMLNRGQTPQLRQLPPMAVMQTLFGAVDELVEAVKRLKANFPTLTDDKALDIAIRLKNMGLPREVK